MIAKLQANRVRRTYLGGGRIDAFTGFTPDGSDGVPRPEDWMASTTTAFNGTLEIEGEGLGSLVDGRLVKDVVGTLPILVKLRRQSGQGFALFPDLRLQLRRLRLKGTGIQILLPNL